MYDVAMAKYLPGNQKSPFNGWHDETKTRYHDTMTRSHGGARDGELELTSGRADARIINLSLSRRSSPCDFLAVVIFLFVVAAWPPRVTRTTGQMLYLASCINEPSRLDNDPAAGHAARFAVVVNYSSFIRSSFIARSVDG